MSLPSSASCAERYPPKKSNRAIKEELDRIASCLEIKGKDPTCPNKDCENHKVSISAGKLHYKSFGVTKAGSQRYMCKACKKTFAVAKTSILRQRKPHKNALIFNLLMNQSAFNRICEVARVELKDKATKVFKIEISHISGKARK